MKDIESARSFYERRVNDWQCASEDPNEASTRRVMLGARIADQHCTASGPSLDVGPATGLMCELLSQKGYDVYAADISPRMIEAVAQRMAKFDVPSDHFRVSDETLPFETESFILVTSLNVLMYVENQPNFVREIHRVLKPGGIAIVDTYNRYSLRAMASLTTRPFYNLPTRTFWRQQWRLFRTGTTSLVTNLDPSRQCYTGSQLDNLFAEELFDVIGSVDCWGVSILDKNPLKRRRITSHAARRLGHTHFGIYRKK